MTVAAAEASTIDDAPARRFGVISVIEAIVVLAAVTMGVVTYVVLTQTNQPEKLLSPAIAALLLLGNLLPVVALLVLIGRRIAKRRAIRANVAGDGRLHVRLVAIFSLLASVPIVLTVIAASIMFQSVNGFWASSNVNQLFESSRSLVGMSQSQAMTRWLNEAKTMAQDIGDNQNYYAKGRILNWYLSNQSFHRHLDEAVLFAYKGGDGINVIGICDYPDKRVCKPLSEADFDQRVTPQLLKVLRKNPHPVLNRTPDTIWALVQVPDMADTYLYVGTSEDAKFLDEQHHIADGVRSNYQALLKHSRELQLQFNAALFAVAVLIIAFAVWIALVVADRLVRPVNALVGAARRVANGDLAVRVPEPTANDEVGTLGSAFNAMTERLQEQTAALENRRALIEAVVSGVSAGVISIDAGRRVQLVNSSAARLLNTCDGDPVGRPLAAIAPELDALLESGSREEIVQIAGGGEPKTLAVKITSDADGQVLTFDDITQQLIDQRRAAWSDVARRIAHEIKNPLTPIQLAAERLQRRYAKQIASDDGTFHRLTDTIVRQVGDLRRMVDEFSSFARMPKPVFREESLVDIGRQALFLHEVAHGNIDFSMVHGDPPPQLVCDRRQIGQALTNIVKNAVEAIDAKGEDAPGMVTMTLSQDDGHTIVEVADDGVGLPAERNRLVEPYMTTRARGTGLGLAIVKKIVEEHFGTIAFTDRQGGGTVVTMTFDRAMLAALDTGEEPADSNGEDRPLALTRNRNS